jgi:signal transduction histidine kinase
MRLSRIGAGYIILLWILVVGIIGTTLLIGYNRNSADLFRLMENEADRLIDVIDVSAAAGIVALDAVEDITADRLLQNARFVEQLSRDALPSQRELDSIVSRNRLHMINILAPDGRSIVRSGTRGESRSGNGHNPAVDAVIDGDTEETVIGFMDGRYYRGKRYGVVVARRGGGAVVVNADSEDMLDIRRQLGLGTLFRELGNREGIRYIVLQDEEGIISASPDVSTMTRIANDSFLTSAEKGISASRRLTDDTGLLLEIVRILVVDDIEVGLIRLGLSLEPVEVIRRHAVHQFILLFIAAMFSGAFVVIFVILRQNYRVLTDEHDRILREVRIMEADTRRAERLASMGQLAAGVAHEIRNPLNAVSIISQRLKNEFVPHADTDEYQSLLTTIRKEIDRISGIVTQFLRYARPQEITHTRVSAAKLMDDVILLIRDHAAATGAEISIDVPADLVCFCDSDQMKQALLNLLLNAVDAIRDNDGEHGTISVWARRGSGDCLISITDTGGGIPQDVLERVFDPYFTTKDTGTGLGLSEVYRIITAHGGTITASNDGPGAMLMIRLPGGKEHDGHAEHPRG